MMSQYQCLAPIVNIMAQSSAILLVVYISHMIPSSNWIADQILKIDILDLIEQSKLI